MQVLASRADFLAVTDDERSAAIKRRFENLGISDREFYEKTGIDRKTLRRAIAGEEGTRQSTYMAIDAALTRLEQFTTGAHAERPDTDYVEFTVEGNFGVRAVVKGPVRDMDELQQAVAKLIREMRGETGGDSGKP